MPAPLPANNVIRARVLGAIGPDTWGIRMFLHGGTISGPYSDAQCADVAEEVFNSFGTYIMPYVCSIAQVQRVEAEDLTTGSAGFGVGSGAAVNGSDATGSPTAGTAACLNFTIGSRYRGGHPRVYLPPPGNGARTDARSWTTGYRASIEASWNLMLTAIQGSTIGTSIGLGQVAVRYHNAHLVLTPPQVFDVLAVRMSPVIASQRRRFNR